MAEEATQAEAQAEAPSAKKGGKLFAEIRTPQGKALLRDEIINRMNRVLRKDLVKAVYFTEFIIQ